MKSAPQKFGRRYPWLTWFRKPAVTLHRGRDYTIRTANMVQMVYQNARLHGYRIGVHVAEDEQSITLYRKDTHYANGR